MPTRPITQQEQEAADKTGGRYRTDLGPGSVAMNHRPPTGGSTYVAKEANTAGAGRGKQGGPTAAELQKYEDKQDAGIFTKGKRMPPSPREMASGGKVSSASKRGDGCITKGKTKGTMITMKGGGYAC
jgi:hypothetical protein